MKLKASNPSKVFKQVDDIAYKVKLPPYMPICSIMNVQTLKLYEPSM